MMEIGALAPYERALSGRAGLLGIRGDDGASLPLDVQRWLAPADIVDNAVLDRCRGPVLDVGSGPGRLVGELCRRGMDVLGVDVAAGAVAISTDRGLPTVRADVFDDIPDAGTWRTILLMDGNVGIGGDPRLLLRRLAELQPVSGLLLVETDTNPDNLQCHRVRFTEDEAAVGPPFRWATVGAEPLVRMAAEVGYESVESWSAAGRSFVALVLTTRTT